MNSVKESVDKQQGWRGHRAQRAHVCVCVHRAVDWEDAREQMLFLRDTEEHTKHLAAMTDHL